MSFWTNLIPGLAGSDGSSTTYQAGDSDRGRIDRLCRELGWDVDEREGRKIRLHFKVPGLGVRKVNIVGGDECVVTFHTYCLAAVPADDISPDLLAYLLCRNITDSGIGMWGIDVDDESDVTFHIMYQALGAGLDAAAFDYICKSLCKETADFEGKLRQAGLLR